MNGSHACVAACLYLGLLGQLRGCLCLQGICQCLGRNKSLPIHWSCTHPGRAGHALLDDGSTGYPCLFGDKLPHLPLSLILVCTYRRLWMTPRPFPTARETEPQGCGTLAALAALAAPAAYMGPSQGCRGGGCRAATAACYLTCRCM